MQQQQYKVIVLDLDGTLTNDKKEITPRTRSALTEAMRLGVKVVLASGRPVYGITALAEELDLKAAAKSVGEKNVEMIHVKDIQSITGYIRGGCTAIGMKKQFVTRIDKSAEMMDKIIVSGGRIGSQLELNPVNLAKACHAEFANITRY